MQQVQFNCGLEALSGMMNLPNVSMYTLIQLAKDNDLNLYLCKVDLDKLHTVKRPAIFHANNHFVLGESGKALEPAEYTGWVLSTKPVGLPLPHSLAKQIVGSKKGGDIFGPIITGIASIINPFLGAAVGTAFQGYKVFGGPGVTPAKGEWWRIPIGAATGYLGGVSKPIFGGISNAVLSGGLNAAAELPGAIKSGNYLSPVLAGLGGYAGQKFTSGAAAGLAGAGVGIGAKISGAFQGGLQGLGIGGGGSSASSGGAGGLASISGTPQGGTGSTGALSRQLGTGAFGSSLAPYTVPQNVLSGGTQLSAGGAFNSLLPSANKLASGSGYQNLVNQSTQAAQTPFPTTTGGNTGTNNNMLQSIFGKLNTGDLLKGGLALAAGSLGKPEQPSYDVNSYYDKAKQLLGETTLPQVTQNQLNKYLTMSIPDIKNELMTPNALNAAQLELDKKYQASLTDVLRAAANSGQSLETSSDVQRQYQEINRQWADAKANLQAQLEQQAQVQAIGIQQWALEQSIQQGQFDYTAAMKLAEFYGVADQLKYTMANNDYQGFQTIIAQMLGMNPASQQQPQQQPQLSSVLGGS